MLRRTPLAALVSAEIVSILGSRMTYLALPWFVLVTTGSAAKMSYVLAAQMLPLALLGIPSGQVVERLGARRTMIACDAARIPLLASLPVLHGAGLLPFPLLLALVFALGAFTAPYFAAQRVILPELVGEDERRIAQANSLIEGGTAVAGLAGPALAGVLIPFIGAPNVLYVDAATYAVGLLLLVGFVPRGRRVATESSGGVLAGLQFFVRDRLLAPMGASLVAINFVGSAISATIPFYAYHAFDSAKVAGLLYAASGAGAVAGSVLAVGLVRRYPPLRLAGVGMVASTLPLWLLPLDLPAGGVMAALFLMMFFIPLVNGPVLGLITTRTPVQLRPKVMAALLSIGTVAAPLGFLAAGQLLGAWEPTSVFAAAAVGMTATALVFAGIAFRHREEAPEAAAVAA